MTVAEAKGCIQPLPSGSGCLKGISREIKRFAVMRLKDEQAQCHGGDTALQQGADGGEIAE